MSVVFSIFTNLYKIWHSDDFQEALSIPVWQSLPSPRYARREAAAQASEDSEPTTAASRYITLTTLPDFTLITIKTLMTKWPVWQYPFPTQECSRGRGTGRRGQQQQAGNSTTLYQLGNASCFLFTSHFLFDLLPSSGQPSCVHAEAWK